MRRGAIHWINLGSVSPPGFGKTRPGLIVSNSAQNQILDSVVVVPLSTNPGEIWPLRLRIAVADGRDSFAVLPGIRQVSKARLLDALGAASPGFMRRLDQALSLYLCD